MTKNTSYDIRLKEVLEMKMSDEKRKILIFGVLASALLIFVVFGINALIDRGFEYLEKDERAKNLIRLTRLESEFKDNIERAKRATAHPCAMVFYEFVAPPVDLAVMPKLVMMGNEISYISLDPSAYFLLPKGDKVDLMMTNQSPERLIFSTKIGEKYSPDSKFCREQK